MWCIGATWSERSGTCNGLRAGVAGATLGLMSTQPQPSSEAETAELRRLGDKVRAGQRLTEDELDYVLAHHPEYRAALAEADEDAREGAHGKPRCAARRIG